jgi:outer membrane protein insertion porin family
VTKVNLFGRGYDFNLNGLLSGKRQTFQAMFSNPRVYDSKFSLTFQAYNSEFQSTDDTQVTERGGNVTVGYPIAKHWSVSGTYGIQSIDINIQDIIQRLFRNSTGLSSALTATISRDTLNTREMFLPSKGTLNTLSTTVASKYLGSDLSYWKSSLLSKRYLQVFDEDSLIFPASVLSLALRADYLKGIEGRSTPFNERFVPGGIYSIRGHLYRSLGPSMVVPFPMNGNKADSGEVDLSDPRSLRLGGNKQIIGNVEFLFDIFKEAKIKGVLFLDGGNAFAENHWDWADLRASAGFGFRWFSPIGPLRFEWGFPMRKTDYSPDSVVFEFSIGSPF